MKRYLHAGCGPIILPSTPHVHWTNVDVQPSHRPDVCCDVREMPFQSDSFDGGISQHMLEHLEAFHGIRSALKEIHRVLKPGATFRFVVPDLKLVAEKYLRGESLQDIFDGPYFIGDLDTPASRFTWWARGFEHTILFDDQTLGILLRECGFREVRKMGFSQSDVAELRGLDRFQPESLCCEAVK